MHLRLLIGLSLLIAACGPGIAPAPAPTPVVFPSPEPHPIDVSLAGPAGWTGGGAAAAWIEARLDSLSLRDRVAQLVMPWIPGSYVAFDDDAFRRYQGWVDSLHVGGIIISIGSPVDVAAKLNSCSSARPCPC